MACWLAAGSSPVSLIAAPATPTPVGSTIRPVIVTLVRGAEICADGLAASCAAPESCLARQGGPEAAPKAHNTSAQLTDFTFLAPLIPANWAWLPPDHHNSCSPLFFDVVSSRQETVNDPQRARAILRPHEIPSGCFIPAAVRFRRVASSGACQARRNHVS